jgi:MoaA/NifB/PqqE/SkfB family radical SAM enzyme
MGGVRTVHGLQPEFPVSGRSVVQRENYHCLRATARTAQQIGLRSISFLAADVASPAFNHLDGWRPEQQVRVALSEEDLPRLEAEIGALLEEWRGDPFLIDGPEKLHRVVQHYRAHLGLCEPVAPRCNAPWVSAVIETGGVVRPCFFHQPVGHAEQGLESALNSPAAQAFRASLDIATNPTCKRCVCSLNWRS